MSNDESNTNERGRDKLTSDQTLDRQDGRGAIDESQIAHEPSKAASEETLENDQHVRNNRKDKNERGRRENWGGYQGY